MKKKIIGIALAMTLCFTSLAFVGCGKKDDNLDGPSANAKTVNIIMTSATIPPMLAMLNTIDSNNQTYMWVGRQNTIYSTDNLRDAYASVNMIEQWSTASNIPKSVVNSMSQYVSNTWYGSNKDCKYEIYVTDYGILSALYLVESIKIPAAYYNIHMLEDGSAAYSRFYVDDNYDDATEGKANFDANLAGLNSVIASMRNGTYTAPQDFSNYQYSYVASTLSNCDYYLQYPELLVSENEEIQDMMDNGTMKLVKKHQTELFNGLTDEGKSKVKSIILDPALDAIMTPEEGKSKVLMITGTSFTGEGNDLNKDTFTNGENCRFEQYVKYLVDTYGDEYTIVYKGHPSWGLLENELESSRWVDASRLNGLTVEQGRAAAERRVQFFNDLGIRILPAQTPAEAFIWAYSDVLSLCGYDSSLYFNAPKENMLAFFLNSELAADQDPYSKLSTLNKMLFEEGGQLHNDNTFFLDLNYIAEHTQTQG